MPNTLILGDEDTVAVCDSASSSYNGPDILMGGYDNRIYGCSGDDLILGGTDTSRMPPRADDAYGGPGADCLEHNSISLPSATSSSEAICSVVLGGDPGDIYDPDFISPPSVNCGSATAPDCSFIWPIPSFF
ncbi:MAG TPA: hypothetical protein RMF84_05080 [Polyangiaceae bacterium LLY-WYZ-14_1]|nr:hypothetical protein [Polyangiaceae bacterium LLY-WYZ-14_1]